jgi:nucleoside-diphosphate-sugar epimerase
VRVFVAGATGAIGRQLVPRLVAAGHEVAGMTRTPSKLDDLRAMGATPILADALDRGHVIGAVKGVAPEAIIHELTDLGRLNMRRFAKSFETTNRLRTEGTDNLLAAAREAGVRRFIAQSYAGWPFARTGRPIKTEDEPLDPNPVPATRAAFEAIAYLEQATIANKWTDGIVLRYGSFYGPRTGLDVEGDQLALLRRGRWPVIGDGGAIWSFIHVADAADATVAALERGKHGIYHVVEDDPPTVAEFLPVVAERIGARPPMRVPRWLGRLLAGEAGTVLMTEIRGASNEKAKRELGWTPRHNWREDLGRRSENSPAS